MTSLVAKLISAQSVSAAHILAQIYFNVATAKPFFNQTFYIIIKTTYDFYD